MLSPPLATSSPIATSSTRSSRPYMRVPSSLTSSGMLACLRILHASQRSTKHTADVFLQSYGRNPHHVRNRISNHPPNRHYRLRLPPSPQTPLNHEKVRHGRTFDEARRRKECFKCAAPWQPGHRSQAGAIAGSARSPRRSGESHVHIIRYKIFGMEGEQVIEKLVCFLRQRETALWQRSWAMPFSILAISETIPHVKPTSSTVI